MHLSLLEIVQINVFIDGMTSEGLPNADRPRASY